MRLFKLASKDDEVQKMVEGNEGMWVYDRLCEAANAVADAAGLLERIGRVSEGVWLEGWARELWGLGEEWWEYERGEKVGG